MKPGNVIELTCCITGDTQYFLVLEDSRFVNLQTNRVCAKGYIPTPKKVYDNLEHFVWRIARPVG